MVSRKASVSFFASGKVFAADAMQSPGIRRRTSSAGIPVRMHSMPHEAAWRYRSDRDGRVRPKERSRSRLHLLNSGPSEAAKHHEALGPIAVAPIRSDPVPDTRGFRRALRGGGHQKQALSKIPFIAMT
jgi:hypothetical protein